MVNYVRVEGDDEGGFGAEGGENVPEMDWVRDEEGVSVDEDSFSDVGGKDLLYEHLHEAS